MEPGYERLCLSDSVALKYLEGDPVVRVVERRQVLSGYELHLVEQWACSREDPTIVITTFTGQVQHKILVSIIEIPTDEKQWSPKLRFISKRLASKHHARKQSIPDVGNIFVTNLSTFPSILTIVPIPNGDLRGNRVVFFLNENLKRMGCSGRAGLRLSPPSDATKTKFRQLYKVTSEQVTVNEAVIELVQMCQIALTMFEKLPQEYCDGLLCDVTERGLADWWTEIGLQYYNIEPSDGMLGPTTVSALLGLFLGARNRLNVWGAPVSKEVFDIHSLKRGIAQFQKSRGLSRTRRLDRDTLQQLHKQTAKAATHEGWAVPRAVKTTVAELGKGGEMVMGMVGAKDKPGIADVETTDIEQFVKKLNGARCKWLWRGKPRKHLFRASTQEDPVDSRPPRDETGGYVWENSSSEDEDTSKPRPSIEGPYEGGPNQSKTSLHSADRDQIARKNVLKTVTGRMTDAKSGLGRFRDAVGTGLRGHNHKISRDINTQEIASPTTRVSTDFAYSRDQVLDKRGQDRPAEETTGKASLDIPRGRPMQGDKGMEANIDQSMPLSPAQSDDEHTQTDRGTGDEDVVVKVKDKKQVYLPAVRRSKSAQAVFLPGQSQSRSPYDVNLRRLSFTDLPALPKDFATQNDDASATTPLAALELEQYKYVQLQHMHDILSKVRNKYSPFAQEKLASLTEVGVQARAVRERLVNAQRERLENSQSSAKVAEETTQEGRDMLTGRLQEIEALGAKLEYEIGALTSKIEDVEDGVADLNRQVQDLESRSRLLAQESRDHSWHHWAESVGRKLRLV